MVELVERMLDLHRQVAIAKTGPVYELYDLTPEEIKIVESAAK